MSKRPRERETTSGEFVPIGRASTEKVKGRPAAVTSGSSKSKGALPTAADPFDIDKLFAEAAAEKVKVVAAVSQTAAKEKKRQKAVAAAEALAATAVRELEVVGRKANRLKGADSPVPIR